MTPERRAWLLIGASKIVLGAIFALVYWKKLPPIALALIPGCYVVVGLMAMRDHVMNAAAFCGIMLGVITIICFVPGPLHVIILRAMGRD